MCNPSTGRNMFFQHFYAKSLKKDENFFKFCKKLFFWVWTWTLVEGYLISVWSVQHPKAGWKMQHICSQKHERPEGCKGWLPKDFKNCDLDGFFGFGCSFYVFLSFLKGLWWSLGTLFSYNSNKNYLTDA